MESGIIPDPQNLYMYFHGIQKKKLAQTPKVKDIGKFCKQVARKYHTYMVVRNQPTGTDRLYPGRMSRILRINNEADLNEFREMLQKPYRVNPSKISISADLSHILTCNLMMLDVLSRLLNTEENLTRVELELRTLKQDARQQTKAKVSRKKVKSR